MNKILWLCCYLAFATPALAGFNVYSELSHATGGALIAGTVTSTVADKYWPENRAVIGFTTSTAVILIGEGAQLVKGAKFSNSLQDIIAHTLGAMIGTIITDRYLLVPAVEHGPAGTTKIGMYLQKSF